MKLSCMKKQHCQMLKTLPGSEVLRPFFAASSLCKCGILCRYNRDASTHYSQQMDLS